MKYILTKDTLEDCKKIASALEIVEDYANAADDVYHRLYAPMRESLDIFSEFGYSVFTEEEAAEINDEMDLEELLEEGYIQKVA